MRFCPNPEVRCASSVLTRLVLVLRIVKGMYSSPESPSRPVGASDRFRMGMHLRMYICNGQGLAEAIGRRGRTSEGGCLRGGWDRSLAASGGGTYVLGCKCMFDVIYYLIYITLHRSDTFCREL
jgi:hypothetical protein